MRRTRPTTGTSAWALILWLLAAGAGAQDDAAGAAEQRTERGPVSALVRLEPATVRIGDAVTLTIEVTAEPGVELLMPVFGASLERFTILEFVPREAIDAAGKTVSTQSYRLLASVSGMHAVPPVTIEFVDRRAGQRPAPDGQDAYELLTERLPFTVESVVPVGAGSELRPPLGRLDPIAPARSTPWPWLAAGLAALLGAGAFALVALRARRRGRRTSAVEVALGRLDALEKKPRPDAAHMDGFFVELSDIVRRYLEDRFELHAPELTTEEFLDVAAASPDLTRAHRQFLQEFLREADRVKFGRFVPDAGDVDSVLGAVRGFLQQTASTEPGGTATVPASREAAHA